MTATRITPELVVNPNRYHLPSQRVGTSVVEGNTTYSSSGNWSGWSLIGGTNPTNSALLLPPALAYFADEARKTLAAR